MCTRSKGALSAASHGVIAATAAIAEYGWLRRRIWGWRLAVLGAIAQVVGDCVNLVRGDLVRGGAGLLIGGALLIYLLSDKLKSNFNSAVNFAEPVDQRVSP